MLGGSSSMNAMMYVRGNRADYDGWARDGATGWSYEEVLPYFKRSEDNAEFHDSYHGIGGEQHVTSKRWLSSHWEPFLDAAAAAGVPRIADCNGAQQDGGVLVQTTTRRGRRWSAADAFLAPVRKRSNLTVATDAHVRRIVIEHGRAAGAEYGEGEKRQVARAEKEVILSAGAYGSPQLLMLSGIGPGDHLREHGIDVRLDQPNVGAHLQEHPMALVNLRCATSDTLDDFVRLEHQR
jgi:choline dehydrogenase